MPRFGVSRFPRAFAAIAAIILAMAGCLAVTVPARAASDFSLVILPDQGENAIYNFVNSATSSIDVTIYELKDTTLENDLVAREKAGVNVRVILDQAQKSYDTAAYNVLTAGGVGVVWSSTAFTYTHQKTITVNNDESYISTGNFDTTYYATSRDFGVFDTDANDVAAIVAVFNADYAHTSITPSDGDDLVWSPTDSQTHLLALINGAQHSLDIEQEEFSDTTLINAIVAAAKRGVTVRVVRRGPVVLQLRGQRGHRRRRQGDRLLLVDRLLHPRQGDHRRLRHVRPPRRSSARRTSPPTRSTTTANSA